ncbi:hypothetical protein B7P43_G05767 [Cryptotermes secundus]|uniref:Uncharacterized protein n=3 Tax=Cryptotermes secundus TaxID=105785 RepID=A0A2J7Q0Q3_9NEOP|nr:serine/arginine repetitive matrix protein 2 isoform X2 [Cryptotermes secundus]PNF22165.1 hypothetical protein B7P43_G05767 [Cryptotermes secundus]
MALRKKPDDDEDDLEALRLAALQTLRSNKQVADSSSSLSSKLHQPQHSAVPGLGRGFSGGITCTQPGRKPIFRRHRFNSNLIAIVPVSNEPSPGNGNSISHAVGKGRTEIVDTSTGPKLGLPQHRYCKPANDQENKLAGPAVSTKFSRYDDTNSDSSADESEDENEGSDKVSIGSGAAAELDNDPDVLIMAADDEEDSLEKLMNELEQAMNKSDSSVPVNTNIKSSSDLQKYKKTSSSKSKHNISDTSESQKCQGGVSTSEAEPVLSNSGNQKTKEFLHSSSSEYTKDITAHVPDVSSSCSSNHNKDSIFSEGDKNAKSSGMCLSHPQKQLSPIFRKMARSRSRSRSISRSPHNCSKSFPKSWRSGSQSPRSRFSYSPLRNRIPRSPRSQMSRSPVYMERTRSRSPLKSTRSPRKRYSRSPPWHQSSSNHASRFSPHSYSPQPRRFISPRQSPSRLNRISPRRSPDSSRWALPCRSLSPQLRQSSFSPSPKRFVSPRDRRISVSPRRPVSPLRRRLSPSPSRRNPSPPRRYSPPRRNPSPPRRRYSCSLSRSPERFVSRSRSPAGNRLLHHRSPVTPKRRMSRSPSLRRRVSHSPFSRLPARHSPPGRKLSPWSPPRQPLNQKTSPAARRYSFSPTGKQRSPSPYGRQKRQLNSPNRRPPLSRLPPRNQRSPVRDLRLPLQESRVNNIRPRSRSPLLPPRTCPGPNIHRDCSPVHSRSPLCKSHSQSSSISLSPSPERGTVNNIHRYKSPLRFRVADYRNPTVPVLHSSKEVSSGRQRNLPSPPGPGKKPLKPQLDKQKEQRNRVQKRNRSKEDRKYSNRKSKEQLQNVAEEGNAAQCPKSIAKSHDGVVSGSNLALMEARKRKFESTGPVKPDGKRIRLKEPHPQQQMRVQEEHEKDPTQQTVSKHMLEEKDKEEVAVLTTLDDSAVIEVGEDFDEPYLELQSADTWSTDESDSDNEARFKSSTHIQAAGSEKIGVLPFTSLHGQIKTVVRKEETSLTKHKKSSFSSRKHDSDKINAESKQRKGLEDVKSQVSDSQQEIKQSAGKQQESEKNPQSGAHFEGKAKNISAVSPGADSKLKHSDGEGSNGAVEAVAARNREGDLRAELSRRRAERLTKAGSLHETLPTRLLQSAFEGVVGKKGVKRSGKEEKMVGDKRKESKKEKNDVRRVLVLKRPAVTERSISSISVTIPKEFKHEVNTESLPAKLPVRMRLGLPAARSAAHDHQIPRKRNRKVELKRNVMLGPRPDEKV